METLTELSKEFSNRKHIYTDKNTTHSYLSLYDELLTPIRETADNILEVGIGNFKDKNGGSLLLWEKYFKKAKIYGVDILDINRVLDECIDNSRIILHTETNAYDKTFISNNLNNIKFDFVLDDGPHTLQSQLNFIDLYSPLLSENGILIIEDVQSGKWFSALSDRTPSHLKKYIKIYDLRKNKNRWDDLVFTIDKLNKFD
tara:strand:+ start:3225 stop:3827 length:603 start_codon:yes stop_codon:yes gene_type:complete